jgi:hypothetical protein
MVDAMKRCIALWLLDHEPAVTWGILVAAILAVWLS